MVTKPGIPLEWREQQCKHCGPQEKVINFKCVLASQQIKADLRRIEKDRNAVRQICRDVSLSMTKYPSEFLLVLYFMISF